MATEADILAAARRVAAADRARAAAHGRQYAAQAEVDAANAAHADALTECRNAETALREMIAEGIAEPPPATKPAPPQGAAPTQQKKK